MFALYGVGVFWPLYWYLGNLLEAIGENQNTILHFPFLSTYQLCLETRKSVSKVKVTDTQINIVLIRNMILSVVFATICDYLTATTKDAESIVEYPPWAEAAVPLGAIVAFAYLYFGRFVLALVITDVYFYGIHRLFHSVDSIYKYAHAFHHVFTLPRALATLYTGAIEMIVLNQMSVSIAPWFLQMTFFETIVWSVLAAINVLIDHSGLTVSINVCSLTPPSVIEMNQNEFNVKTPKISWLAKSKIHDEHHLHYNVNYGTFGFCDWLFSTTSRLK